MQTPNEKDLAALAIDLLAKCQPGDEIKIGTTCGNTLITLEVRRACEPITTNRGS